MGLVFLFTYIGVPSIYYGDEIWLEGGRDLDCRRCVIWDKTKWNQPLLNIYKRLIRIRKTSKALEKGSFRTIHLHKNILCFTRQYRNEVILTILNNDSSSELVNIQLGNIGLMNTTMFDLLELSSAQITEGILTLQVSDYSSKICSTIKI